MYKDTSYKEKFVVLQDWIPYFVDDIKKDLKAEHLANDRAFVKKYFQGKVIAKLKSEEMVPAYQEELKNGENAEQLCEFVSNRWLIKHSEIYDFFEQKLSQIDPNFTELEELAESDSKKLLEESSQQFGASPAYLFSVINSVVFPKKVYEEFAKRAARERETRKEEEAKAAENASWEARLQAAEENAARIKDRYEKKFSGLQKKYHQDVESLKKQVAILQRKVNANI